MRLTTKGRYAVMALVEMVQNNHDFAPITLQKLSQNLDIKLSYLEQIFHKLKKAGIVESVKGPGGGYYISKSPKEISVLDIIEAADEPIKMTRCDNIKSCIAPKAKCSTHHLWNGLSKQIHQYFEGISLEKIKNNEMN